MSHPHIGFVTNYRHSPAILIVLAAAEAVVSKGAEVSIRSLTPPRLPLHPRFDSTVSSAHSIPMNNWLQPLDWVVFASDEIDVTSWQVARALDKKIILLLLWHQVRSKDSVYYQQATGIVSPVLQVCELLESRWSLKNLIYIPPDPGHIVRPSRSRIIGKPKLLVYLDGRHRRDLDADFVSSLTLPNVHSPVTVVFRRRLLTSDLYRFLNRLKNQGCITLIDERSMTNTQRTTLFLEHDLMLWPCLRHTTAWPVLQAVSMGLPVVTYNTAPHNEFLKDNLDARFIECETTVTGLDMPTVVPTPGALQGMLQQVLSGDTLMDLRHNTGRRVADQHKVSAGGWCDILGC